MFNIKVILLKDIKNIGKKDQIIEASDGYARNYLFPKNLAQEATTQNLQKLNTKLEKLKDEQTHQLNEAQELSQKIGQESIVIKAKAGKSGKLFGAITSREIAQALEEQSKISIDKKKIVLVRDIKSIGEFTTDIKLHPKVVANLSIKIIPIGTE